MVSEETVRNKVLPYRELPKSYCRRCGKSMNRVKVWDKKIGYNAVTGKLIVKGQGIRCCSSWRFWHDRTMFFNQGRGWEEYTNTSCAS